MSARILIVDDIQANLDVLEVKLQLNSYEILTANRGQEALKIAAQKHPDLIILDIMMPDMDGFEVCAALKQNTQTEHIPVIMLTALSDREHKLKGLDVGAEDFLSKPIQDRALLTRIKALVRGKMTMDESWLRAQLSEEISGHKAVTVQNISIEKASLFLISSNKAETKNITRALERDNLQLTSFKSFDEARNDLNKAKPELLILDLHHIDKDILDHIAGLRAHENTRSLPLLGLSDDDNTETLVKALDLGLNDYVMRPLDPHEIYVRVRGQLKRWRYHLNLISLYQNDASSAYIDKITQLYNRRFLNAYLNLIIDKMTIQNKHFSILKITIDHNQKMTSDEKLQEIAFTLKDTVRDFDLVGRYTDTAFIVILPDTSLAHARGIRKRILQKIKKEQFITIEPFIYTKGSTADETRLHLDKIMSEKQN